MTLPRYGAICDHWAKIPPLAVSASVIAQILGAEKPKPRLKGEAEEMEQASNRQALMDLLGGAGFNQRAPEWLTETTT